MEEAEAKPVHNYEVEEAEAKPVHNYDDVEEVQDALYS